MERNNELICVFCGTEIPDKKVASSAKPVKEGYCCVECYCKNVISAKVAKELNDADIEKKYGKGATVEKRIFGKK